MSSAHSCPRSPPFSFFCLFGNIQRKAIKSQLNKRFPLPSISIRNHSQNSNIATLQQMHFILYRTRTLKTIPFLDSKMQGTFGGPDKLMRVSIFLICSVENPSYAGSQRNKSLDVLHFTSPFFHIQSNERKAHLLMS